MKDEPAGQRRVIREIRGSFFIDVAVIANLCTQKTIRT